MGKNKAGFHYKPHPQHNIGEFTISPASPWEVKGLDPRSNASIF